MVDSRRNFLKVAASAAAAGAMLSGRAQADDVASAKAPVTIPNVPSVKLRLVSFSVDGSPPRLGVVTQTGGVVDIAEATKARSLTPNFNPLSMNALIASGEQGLRQVRLIAEEATSFLDLNAVRLHAPIPDPARNVYCVGWNYQDHFNESATAAAANQVLPEHPVFFTKATHCVNGPFDPIPHDELVSVKMDWEGELAVIIGKRGRNVPEANAMDYVFGYTVINDTTGRDVQQKKHGGQWFKGKSLDGHGPMGPWIIPAAELDYTNLHVITRVNGVVKQDANTSQMYFKIPRIIAELTNGLTLEPGDIIATGTPSGTGDGRKPPEYLQPGDILETEIAEIGMIRNPVLHVEHLTI
jgi:2-keto-4-pentenoate hydratase/2-oxohepta-3-ene-1,7-dioic acid hydratase in catechol pathway